MPRRERSPRAMEAAPALPLFAVAAPGLEELVARELAGLGVDARTEPGGAGWMGSMEQLQSANLWLRTASRVLLRVGEFRAKTFFELERYARRLPWQRFVAPGSAVQWRVTCRKSRLYHAGAVAQRLQEAVEHQVGEVVPAGGEGEEEGAHAQLFVVRFFHDHCTVSADSSGALLHRRGYRQALAKAPLRETLAAALLLASDWDGRAPLVDPMCGSGSIPIEAALLARRIAPGLAGADRAPRRYAFQEWPEHDARLWSAALERARGGILPAANAPIHGSDRDAGALEATRANAERAGVLADLTLAVQPLSALAPPPQSGWLVTNPPYGARVGESDALRSLYASLGRVARQRLPGWTVALLSADRRLEGQVQLPFQEALRTRNGGIPVRVVVGRVG